MVNKTLEGKSKLKLGKKDIEKLREKQDDVLSKGGK